MSSFKSALKLTMPVGVDSDRQIYSKYANKIIPRNYVIDKTGKVIFASVGFEKSEFEKMKSLIEQQLGVASVVAGRSESSRPNPLKLASDDIAAERYDSACLRLKSILQKWPANAQAHYLLAVSYAKTKQFDLAKDEYRATARFADDQKLRDLAATGLAKLHALAN